MWLFELLSDKSFQQAVVIAALLAVVLVYS